MDDSDPRHPGQSPDDGPAPVPGAGRVPGASPGVGVGATADDPDPEWAEYTAWVDREVAAGRDREPDIWDPEEDGPVDPLELDPGRADPPDFSYPSPAAPHVPGETASGPRAPDREPPATGQDPSSAEPMPAVPRFFDQGGTGDQLPPGPVLAGLTDNAAGNLTGMSDDELIGVLQATRRQVAHEQYKQVLVTAEFARRRWAEFDAAASRGARMNCRPGGFPGDELAIEMVTTLIDAGHRIDDAIDLTSRLPHTLAGMAAGLIDADRAGWIALYTRSLSAADAAYADEVLAAAAPDLRVDQLARKAAALEKKLNPEAVKARRERARRDEQRVEVRRELSGNASLSGREMATGDVLASKAHIDAIAAKLRRAGLPGTLGNLRVLAMTDLTQGRDPLDRLRGSSPAAPQPAANTTPPPPGARASRRGPGFPPGPGSASGEGSASGHGSASGPGSASGHGSASGQETANETAGVPPAAGQWVPAGPAPLAALINITVPVGTLLGWSTTPALASGWGLLDHDEARTIAEAAARHPRTRWCATLTAPDGTALAHACAAGQHPRLLHDLQSQPPGDHEPWAPATSQPHPATSKEQVPEPPRDQPPRAQPPPVGHVTELLDRLGLAFTPVAQGSCDHAQAETRYTPSRKLRHLVRARTATCDAPGCQAEALSADLDHTHPWPDGPTDQCNLAPRCRTHHRVKQAPDWTVEQVAPGTTRWTLPSGRTHITKPTEYDD
jgi:hypothetical protein